MTSAVPTIQPERKLRSRRALLAGALGGLGALAASALRAPQVAQAGVNFVQLETVNDASSNTEIHNSSGNTSTAFSGTTVGLGSGVYGQGGGSGVFGYTPGGADARGVTGLAYNDGTGVLGQSTTAAASVAGKAKTGVFGYAAQGSGARGVIGQSKSGHGVHGIATTGFAGYFAGKVYSSKWYELKEITAPPAAPANGARLFVRDNGSGKTQLCVRFHTGSVKVLATEP